MRGLVVVCMPVVVRMLVLSLVVATTRLPSAELALVRVVAQVVCGPALCSTMIALRPPRSWRWQGGAAT